MQRLFVSTISELNSILKKNTLWANGKNIKIDHLHRTIALSRWKYENIYGIYVTKPDYAWMAVWMAITDRNKLKKRQLCYHYPSLKDNDYIGSIEIQSEKDVRDLVRHEAYVYLFSPYAHKDVRSINCSPIKQAEKIGHLKAHGFLEQSIIHKDISKTTYVRDNEPAVIYVDDWQIALTGIEHIIPTTELIIPEKVIEELAKRIVITSREIGEEYIVYPE
jgi:hypothetical protein